MLNSKKKDSSACDLALTETLEGIKRDWKSYTLLEPCDFLKYLSDEKYDQTYTELRNFLGSVTKDMKTFKSREDYFVHTYKLCINQVVREKLKTTFEVFNTFKTLTITSKKFFISTFLQDFFQKLMVKLRIGVEASIIKSIKKKEKEDKIKDELDIPREAFNLDNEANKSKESLDTLHYVAGFVLKRLSQQKCSPTVLKALLKTDCDTESSEAEQHEEWTRALDRGKLLMPTDACFSLFKKIKKFCDNFYVYNISELRDNKLKELTMEAIEKDLELTNEWVQLTGTESHNKWFRKLVDIFLNTRGKLLVNDVKEEYQFRTKESIRRKLALRKALQESNKQDSVNVNKNKRGKENSPNKKSLKLCTTPARSSQPTVIQKLNLAPNSSNTEDFGFLNDDPDADLFLQYM